MDFGFHRGKYIQKDELGCRITSIDGYNVYQLIMDQHSRYTWIMFSKTKQPPFEFIKQFFQHHGLTEGRRIVTTDNGGELHHSLTFRTVILNAGYLMQCTAADAPFQNGMAKRPNQTFGNMMRCLLHSSNLPSEYWSYDLIHAVRIKNTLPHSSTDQTPYLAYTGNHPTAENLCIFGCRVYVHLPGERSHKLANHATYDTFLGYNATPKSIINIDNQTKKIKTATHVIFDEANITLTADQ